MTSRFPKLVSLVLVPSLCALALAGNALAQGDPGSASPAPAKPSTWQERQALAKKAQEEAIAEALFLAEQRRLRTLLEKASTAFQLEDYPAAMEIFLLLAEEKNPTSLAMLGYMHETGSGVDKDYGRALEWYMDAAKAGSTTAMERLGWFHQQGWGVDQNYQVAAQWYRAASERKNATAIFNLAWLYEQGLGVGKDENEARNLYLWAAELKSPKAMHAAARLLMKGGHADSAIDFYRQAAELGFALSHRALGLIYQDGTVAPKDEKKAFEHFQHAADAGDSLGQYYLGRIHELGLGVQVNNEVAYTWYRLAAAQGNTLAQWSVGRLHATGRGAAYSLSRAYMWFDIASDDGGAEFLGLRDEVRKAMSEAEFDEAVKITEACRAANFLVCE